MTRPNGLSRPAARRLAAWVTLLLAWPMMAWAADPQIATFNDNPDPVPAGGVYSYTARVDNNATDTATNVRLVLPVPAGAVFVSATAPCALVGSNVECNLGSIGPNGNDIRNLTLTFRALGPGPASISAIATLSADNDSNLGNNVQNQLTTVINGANLALAKSGAPNPVVGGTNVTYTLTPSNGGPNDSGAIVITDNLPPSVSFVSALGPNWSCAHANGVVTCSRPGPHAIGPIAPITIVGTVLASGGTITNSASIAAAADGGVPDPDNSNNTATVNTQVLPGADVRIAQKRVVSPTPAVASQNVTFEIQPRNGGPADASTVSVSDTLPAGWTFVSASGPGWTCGAVARAVTCTRATLAFGATDNITIVATAPDNATVGPTGSSYVNSAGITSATTDPNPANNAGSVLVLVLPDGADLRLSKVKSPNPVARGANLSSTIRVTNNGPRMATGPLRVIEQLNGESFVAALGTGWTCVVTGNTVVCDHPNTGGLAVNATLPTLNITTLAQATGVVSNTACTSNSIPPGADPAALPLPPLQGDPNPSNDCATTNSNSTVIQPDLGIAKTTSTPTGGDKRVTASEGSVTYTLVVSNLTSPGTDAATGIIIRDTVPAFITARTTVNPVTASVSSGTATFNCAIAGAAVTCTQSGGLLSPGQTVTVPITVNRPMLEGSFTNTATVANVAQGDANPANNSATDTVVIDPIADVEMTGKSVTPITVRAGENATFVLSFRNNGPSTAAGVAVSDAFDFPPGDSGVTVISVASSKPGSSCNVSPGAVLNPAQPQFACNIGSLANGETQTVTLVARPNFMPGNGARNFANTASITTSTPESPNGNDNGNNSRSAALPVAPAAVDLLLNKTDFEDPVIFNNGAFMNYRVRVTSNGPSYATNVRISEVMTPPPGRRVRFVCDTVGPSASTCNAQPLCSVANVDSAPGTALPTFTCSVPAGSASTGLAVGDLAPNRSKDIFLRFLVLDQPPANGDVYNNVATVLANEPDTFPINDVSDEQTTSRQRIDLAVTKSASPTSLSLRQPFVWTVTVRNNGPGNSIQTDLTDTLPAGVTVIGPVTFVKSAPAGGGNCSVASVNIACTMGTLNSGGVITISIPARIDTFPPNGSLTNTARVDTDPAKIGGIDPIPGNDAASSTITVTRSSIAGTAFEDRDRAGANGGTPQAAAMEPRLSGVTVRLTGIDAFGNVVDSFTTTDASGNYSFGDLSPSNAAGYALTQTQPGSLLNSPSSPPQAGPAAPSAGGLYSRGGNSGDSGYGAIVLGSSQAAVNYNFPELRRPTLSGFVYLDGNNNAVRDPATDAPIAGATVRLLDAASGSLIAATVTDANGAYSFANLDPFIVYTLEEPLPGVPTGLRNGAVNPGLVQGTACASGCTAQPDTPTAGTDRIAAIDLTSGADGTQFNFGETQLSFISGLVFVDANRNDSLDASDTGRVLGVTLRLVQGADCSSGTTLQSTTTVADGRYRFDNVPAFQNYLVCETQPAGYGVGSARGTPGSNVIAVNALGTTGSTDNDFGETLAALSGSVYADYSPNAPAQNNNGNRDVGEVGIVAVPLTLTGIDVFGNAVNRTVSTDASGNFVFDGLFPPNAQGYTVSEGAIPPGSGIFNDGLEQVGSAGGSLAVNDVVSGIALAAGQVGSGYLFGELPAAPISGIVYLDRNRNLQMDAEPTDGRLGNVTIRLVDGLSCAGVARLTLVTGSDGSYLFSGQSVGLNYSVCEVQPAGHANGATHPGVNGSSATSDQIQVTALPLNGSPGNNFGEQLGSIAGFVYLDAANDGSRVGDAALAGVRVTLTGTDATGTPVNRNTLTDADGAWVFRDMVGAGAGGYSVTEQLAQPLVGVTATLNGRTSAGSVGGSATAVAVVPSGVSAIALGAGIDATEYNFGEILPVSIAGTVFVDANDNGVQDGLTDPGLAGVTLVITGTDDTGAAVSRTVVTGPDGRYSITDLRPGTYTITEPEQPSGTSNGKTVAGSSGGTASAQAVTPSVISALVLLTPGTNSTGNNFAEIPNGGALNGRVWLDANNNGRLDPNEAGITAVALNLTGTDSLGRPVARSTVTDANGNYRFDSLAPGVYSVTEPTQPASTLNGVTLPGSTGGTATTVATTPSALSAITLGVSQQSVNNNFAEIPSSSIAGQVWSDINNNGSVDPVEAGLPGVTLVLTGTDDLGRPVSVTVVTDANGNYSFTGLRPGLYTVTEPTQPPGTVDGITVPGSLGGGATLPGFLPSAIVAITLTPGGQSVNNNFGEIGQSPDLRVTKNSQEARFSVANLGHYSITVRNVGERDTLGPYTVRDRLPAGLTLDAVPVGTGWVCNGQIGANSFSCSASTVIAADASGVSPIAVTVRVGAAALPASPVNNLVLVEGGGELDVRGPTAVERAAFDAGNANALPVCETPAAHNVCRVATPVQASAAISGTVWYDIGDRTALLDAADRRLQGWLVELVDPLSGQVVARAVTAADGSYRIADLIPGIAYAVRFRDPSSSVVFGYPVNGETAPGSSGSTCDPVAAAANGSASSCVERGVQPQLGVVLAPGQELVQQSLPVDPSGVVYDSSTRSPVAGSVVSLTPVGSCPAWNPAAHIVGAGLGGYSVNGASIAMTVGADGFYQFLFATASPPSCSFTIGVTPPPGYLFQSTLIAPQPGNLAPPGGPNDTFSVQPQATAPNGPIGVATQYFLSVTAGSAVPNVVHNHIPLDPERPGALTLSKSGDKAVVEVGDTVRYTVAVQLTSGRRPAQVSLIDRLPAGFTFVAGTALVDGVAVADPVGVPGPRLIFNLGPMAATNRITLQYRARVGVGSQQGDGINRAQAWGCSIPAGCVDLTSGAPRPNSSATNEGRHRVRVSGGVFTTDACFAGKVFVDCNGNHIQDREELGIPGVRLVLQDGSTLISDSEGKYSLCGLQPRSHVLRLDPHTLPTGSRLTTSSNRNLGDAGSLWLDLKNGELHRADFIEGSCSNPVLDQVKARRAQGEVRAPETEVKRGPALRFDSKAHGRNALTTPQQGTDSANQRTPQPRTDGGRDGPR